MIILRNFQWYRRARGGYWAQVTGFFGPRWIKCEHSQPIPGYNWIFYPWATKTMGNGYLDEWFSEEPCFVVPLSTVLERVQNENEQLRRINTEVTRIASQQSVEINRLKAIIGEP